MIDDGPMKCTCGHMDWLGCYDRETGFYICNKCIKKIGHEPPFTNKEYNRINIKKLKKEYIPTFSKKNNIAGSTDTTPSSFVIDTCNMSMFSGL